MTRLDVTTGIQAASAFFAALAAIAAWRATIQIKKGRNDEWRLRKTEQLKTIHALVVVLSQTGPGDSTLGWQVPQLNLRREVTVVFQHPLVKCHELAEAEVRRMDPREYFALVAEAMGEVEAAQRAIWVDLSDSG
jgi:hypothetical protein